MSELAPLGIEIRNADHAEAIRLRSALYAIANMGTDMPPAYGDEAGWYRDRAWSAIGIAARALTTPTDTAPNPDGAG